MRAEATGINTARQKLIAFTLSGIFSGTAGALMLYLKGSAFPSYLDISTSFDVFVMSLLGGLQSLNGPIVGAAIYRAMKTTLQAYVYHWNMIIGAVLVLLALFMPRGISGLIEDFGPLSWQANPRAIRREAESMTMLSVSGLVKNFGGVRAVDDIEFDVAPGEILALIGPNGAGKTTCFNVLNGQLKPDAGRILFNGNDITGNKPRDIWRQGVGRTFQITQTYGSMSVLENVQMALISFSWHAVVDARSSQRILLRRGDGATGAGRHGRIRPAAAAACWRMAISNGSSWRLRSPISPSFC